MTARFASWTAAACRPRLEKRFREAGEDISAASLGRSLSGCAMMRSGSLLAVAIESTTLPSRQSEDVAGRENDREK